VTFLFIVQGSWSFCAGADFVLLGEREGLCCGLGACSNSTMCLAVCVCVCLFVCYRTIPTSTWSWNLCLGEKCSPISEELVDSGKEI